MSNVQSWLTSISAGIRSDMREQCWRSAERWLTSVSATITLELTVHRVASAAPPINTDINKYLGINKDGYTNACSPQSQVIHSIAGATKVYVKHECRLAFTAYHSIHSLFTSLTSSAFFYPYDTSTIFSREGALTQKGHKKR